MGGGRVVMKICVKCNKSKGIKDFHKMSASRDGHNRRCKDCVNEYARNHYNSSPKWKESRKLRILKMGEDSRERLRQYGRDWYNTPTGRAKTLMKGIKDRSKKYEEVLDFDENYLKLIIENGYCQATGIPFELGSARDSKKRAFSPSIDRIDNNKGYFKENVRLVIWQYNLMKGELTDEELALLCIDVLESVWIRKGG